MTKLFLPALVAAAALGIGMTALAQDLPEPRDRADAAAMPPPSPPPPGPHGGGRPIPRTVVPAIVAQGFASMDANGDGVVTREEYAAARAAQRAAREERRGTANGDGAASPPPHRPGGNAGRLLGGRGWFETADANGDGRVTLEEAQAAALTTFDRLDTDHDGVLSPDERHAAMAAMRGGDRPPPQ